MVYRAETGQVKGRNLMERCWFESSSQPNPFWVHKGLSKMNKAELLDKVKELITRDRNETHGDANVQLANTAKLWEAYLQFPVTAEQVAMCMVLMKISRSDYGVFNEDDYLDLLGYGAIAGEIAFIENCKSK